MQRTGWASGSPWLGNAKQAKRYEPRQFPFMNLGRFAFARGAGLSKGGGSTRRAAVKSAGGRLAALYFAFGEPTWRS